MTRLKQHLVNEMTEKNLKLVEAFKSAVKKGCKPYLNSIKKCPVSKSVFRGIVGNSSMMSKRVRTNRKPKDLKQDLHEMADMLFLEHWGWRARSSGMFVTGDYGSTLPYGDNAYMVFPQGNFKFLWSPKIDDFVRINFEKANEIIKNQYTDKNLCAAITSGHEIMIQCESYYAIRDDILIDYVEDVLGKENDYLGMGEHMVSLMGSDFIESIG